MRIDRLWRPLIWIFGGTADRSFVEVADESVRFRFGFFDETVPGAEIAGVERYEPRWYHGIGWRWVPGHVLLLGSHAGVVSFRLTRSRRVRLLPVLPRVWPARRLSVSLEDPDAVLSAFRGT
jgi:hypothetical protein